jgi:hypothetical protein
MNPRKCISGCLLALGLGLAVTGCGGKAKVTGQILKGGQPFKLSDKGVLEVSLIPEKGNSNPIGADAHPDGSFTIAEGVPYGKYKVVVQAFDPYPGDDLLGGKFKEGSTKLTTEVTGKEELRIDVGK